MSISYSWTDQVVEANQGNLGSESSILVSRIITRDDGAVIGIEDEIETMIEAGALPNQDEIYTYPPVTGGITSWPANCRNRGFTLRLLETGKAVRADIRYTTRFCVIPSEITPKEVILPAHTSYITTARTMQIYRTSWSVNPPTSASNSSATDIGGTSLSGADGSQSIQVGQVRVRVIAMQDASTNPMHAAASTLTNYSGTINNAAFAGFPAYSLICEGVSLEKDLGTEFYTVTFEFLFDRYYHFNQVVTMDADGRPRMTSGGALFEVKWQRLPRVSTDFNNIFSGDVDLQTLALNGWWV